VALSVTVTSLACHDSSAPAPDHFREGAYTLKSVGTRGLPYLVAEAPGYRLTILSDTLALIGGTLFEIPVTLKEQAGLPDSVTAGSRTSGTPFRVTNDSIFVTNTVGEDTILYRAGRLYVNTHIPPLACARPCQLVWQFAK
jgi:hypothetical protein